MKRNLLIFFLVLCPVLGPSLRAADHFVETFDTFPSAYMTGDVALPSGTWNALQVYGEAVSASRGGTGSAARINDDTPNAQLTTPALLTVGNVSFYYRELNNGGGTFKVQKSIAGGTFTDVDSHTYSGLIYQFYTVNVNDGSADVRIRILSNSNPGHLIIDDMTVTDFIVSSNSPPFLSINPPETNIVVEEGTEISFSLSAQELDGDSMTLACTNLPAGSTFTPNPHIGTQSVSSAFVWASPVTGQTSVVFSAADPDGTNSLMVQIEVQAVDPNRLLWEQFDEGMDVPADWVNSGTERDTSHFQSGPLCRALSAGDTLMTPAVDFPTNISFYVDASVAGNGQTAEVAYRSGANEWTHLGSFIVGTAGSVESFSLLELPDASESEAVQFQFSSSFSTWYLDDVLIWGQDMANQPPDLEPIGNQLAAVDCALIVPVIATDYDGHDITLYASNLPPGATFDTVTNAGAITNWLTYVPEEVEAGLVYTSTFYAVDFDGVTEETITISVYDYLVGFLSSGSTVWENAGTQLVAVAVSRPVDAIVDVGVAGTATAGPDGDYELLTTQLVFAADGICTQWLELVLLDDGGAEPVESVVLMLTNAAGTGIGPAFQYEVILRDNEAALFEPLDQNPGWSEQGQWDFGQPLGGGGLYYGYPDPTAGYTGTNIYGYNLAGDYPGSMPTTYYLTTKAIDCTQFRNLRLEFQRWLGAIYDPFAVAVVEASLDRSTWVNVWSNGGNWVEDADWTNMEYDVSALADGQPTVYFRWGMGPSTHYGMCGWNIDDIALTGDWVSNALFRFAAEGYAARETSTDAQVTIERFGLTNTTAEVVFATSNRTATAGLDYEAVDELLVFAPGELSRTVSIPLLDDGEMEHDETVGLSLVSTATGDVASPSEAMLVLQDDDFPGASIPFFDGFESGSFSNVWTTNTTATGRLWIGGGGRVMPFEGARQVNMDAVNYTYGLGELVLTADLSGQTNVMLDVQEFHYNYPVHSLPAQFIGSTNADGVAVSVDGLTWHRLYDDVNRWEGYTNRVVNLTAFAASNGLALGPHVEIKFQHYGRYPYTGYCRCLDNIQLYDPTQIADVQLRVVESGDPVLPGSNLVLTLVVTNAGPLAATGLVVSNGLPTTASLVAMESSQGICSQQNQSVYCDLGDLAAGESETVTLTVTQAELGVLTNRAAVWGNVFDPYRTNDQVVTTTVVDERGGTLQFDASAIEADESSGEATVQVVRSGPTYGDVTVEYATADGTALAGTDYVATTGTLVLVSGQLEASLTIPLQDDSADEPTENFGLTLFNPGGEAVLGETNTATISIIDDDGRALFPFTETFESGFLTNYWRTYSTGAGRVMVTTNNEPHAGTYQVTMDREYYGSNDLNELILTIDLSGQQGVTLAFWHKQFNDEGQAMSTTFSGHQDSDGIAVSDDGLNWVKVQGLTSSEGSSEEYERFEVSLDPIATANGLVYTSMFRIKFQQIDNFPIPTDGFAFDDISLFAQHGDFRFAASGQEADETAGTVVVEVERANGSLGEVTVQYATADGTAMAGTDYTAASGTLTFASGVTTGSFEVAILDDGDDESAETILLALFDPSGDAGLAFPSNAVLSILDDDGPGELVFGASGFSVSESGIQAAVSVLRTGGTQGEVSVDYATVDETATAGADYLAATGTLVFADGVVSQSFAVAILDDADTEGSETIRLMLENPVGAALGALSTASLQIVDDEDPTLAYYESAFGKTGVDLREALHEIINDHTPFSYDTILSILRETDECPTNAAQIQMVYMQQGRGKYENGMYSGQWNREHVWPQSHGFPDALSITVPPSVDAHNLKPSDVDINSQRGNKDFENGGTPVAGAPPTCRTTSGTFEPPDETKGDVARILFYMDVRYEGDRDGEPDLELVDSDDTYGTQMGKLSTLMQWNIQDPPDAFEQNRNELIYSNWQGNRNPFIDHPEWALELWAYTRTIATQAGEGGSISPENPEVLYPSDQAFEIQPDPYWAIANILTNGVSMGVDYGTSSYSLVWSAIPLTGTVEAVFTADLAAQGTPLWWLAEQGFTNDFDIAEGEDPDEDGCPTWQEYLAGSLPNNAASLLQFEAVDSASVENGLVIRWQSASNRTYSIWKGSNLLVDFTQCLASNLPANPPMNTHTDTVDGLRLQFYRIDVEP